MQLHAHTRMRTCTHTNTHTHKHIYICHRVSLQEEEPLRLMHGARGTFFLEDLGALAPVLSSFGLPVASPVDVGTFSCCIICPLFKPQWLETLDVLPWWHRGMFSSGMAWMYTIFYNITVLVTPFSLTSVLFFENSQNVCQGEAKSKWLDFIFILNSGNKGLQFKTIINIMDEDLFFSVANLVFAFGHGPKCLK